MDDKEVEDAQLQRNESTWPAERVPGKLDAQQANLPIASSFMESYKHALLVDESGDETFEYIDDDSEALLHQFESQNSNVEPLANGMGHG